MLLGMDGRHGELLTLSHLLVQPGGDVASLQPIAVAGTVIV